MKIVYIGAGDGLAEILTERMWQEGNDVYLLSDKALLQKPKGITHHHFYRIPRNGQSFCRLLSSISPDCVIFAGNHYIYSVTEEESEEDITLLARSLRTAAEFSNVKFILLSSTEVYGNTTTNADESSERTSVSERGIRFIREEQLIDVYQKQHNMETVILRASQLYSNHPKEGKGDFLSRIFYSSVQAEVSMPEDVFQPIHVSDFADAVKRVIDSGKQRVYNVCPNTKVNAERLYKLICQHEKIQEQDVKWEAPDCITLADSTRIRHELGWKNFRNLEEQLQNGEITYERTPTKDSKKKKLRIPIWIRQLVENLLIFAAFYTVNSLGASHSILSNIDWLMIYVILIAITYNIYQSALSAILASAAYLHSQNLNIIELNTFSSYAVNILTIMEFVFLGLMVSYTASMLREECRSVRLDLEILKDEYDDLRAIDDENVLIKNEYEERLLTSKSGLPKLYGLISRLMVQEPDRILMETMQVISEMVRTDTVAIYQGQADSPWLRLAGALSDNSAMDGKSWNLSDYPRIYNAVERGELYMGELGSGEPAAVLPIICRNVPAAVVLIKTLPYECETLYHVNLLKTMSLLLRDSMEKAMQYEELSREEHYIKDTDILKPESFRRRVVLAAEKSERFVAEYCVVELVHTGSLTETANAETANAVSQILRVTDCLGTDEGGRLFALLNNTGPGNLDHLQKRLLTCGVEAHLVLDELAEFLKEPAAVPDGMVTV